MVQRVEILSGKNAFLPLFIFSSSHISALKKKIFFRNQSDKSLTSTESLVPRGVPLPLAVADTMPPGGTSYSPAIRGPSVLLKEGQLGSLTLQWPRRSQSHGVIYEPLKNPKTLGGIPACYEWMEERRLGTEFLSRNLI